MTRRTHCDVCDDLNSDDDPSCQECGKSYCATCAIKMYPNESSLTTRMAILSLLAYDWSDHYAARLQQNHLNKIVDDLPAMRTIILAQPFTDVGYPNNSLFGDEEKDDDDFASGQWKDQVIAAATQLEHQLEEIIRQPIVTTSIINQLQTPLTNLFRYVDEDTIPYVCCSVESNPTMSHNGCTKFCTHG